MVRKTVAVVWSMVCIAVKKASRPKKAMNTPLRDIQNLTIRPWQPEDQQAVDRLYTEGLLAGQIDENDTGADIENIAEAFLSEPANGFWVADVDGQALGMIGVVRDDVQPMAEIRRLRVDPNWQDSIIAPRLVETALQHCRDHGYLKVVLDTRFERDAALDLFDRFGFKHNRTKPFADRELLEFYLDLYRKEE